MSMLPLQTNDISVEPTNKVDKKNRVKEKKAEAIYHARYITAEPDLFHKP